MNCKCVGKLTGEKWSKYLDIYIDEYMTLTFSVRLFTQYPVETPKLKLS